MEYGGFEGIIPEGNYGAGSVMLWDNGTWEPLHDADAGMREGKLHFVLHGQKLEGEWTLVRMRARSEASGKDEWLLIKSGDNIKPISAKKDDESVLTQRTMAQIAGEKSRTWQSNRTAAPRASFKERVAAAAHKSTAKPKASAARRTRARQSSAKTRSKSADDDAAAGTPHGITELLQDCPKESPRFIEPMKARLVESLRDNEPWLLEIKHDGYRAIAVKKGDYVELFSRNHLKMTAKFPSVAEAVCALPFDQFVIDGEIVALNEKGQGSFQLLQNRERITDTNSIVFYIFDLLNLEGRNVRDLPLTARRNLLQPIIAKARDPIRFSAALKGDVDVVMAQVKRLGLEGIIAKKTSSIYEVGQRSGSWVKLKSLNEQEFVIGGYTKPKGARDFFGALLIGYYEGDKLMFASKVGTGFDQATLRALFQQFKPLRRDKCPFVNLPTKRGGRFGQGVSASEMRLCTWIEPKLVAQIRFTEWTGDGGLRHPVFLGLREDKRAREVVRE